MQKKKAFIGEFMCFCSFIIEALVRRQISILLIFYKLEKKYFLDETSDFNWINS